MTNPKFSSHSLIWTWGETKIHLGESTHAGYDAITLCGRIFHIANPFLSTPTTADDPLLCKTCRDVVTHQYRGGLPAANETLAILL